MQNERKKHLLNVMKSFNKNNKEKVLSFANEKVDSEVIPTGIEKVDNFLGGGTKKSTFTILWGAFSSGKTSLVLTEIANAQRQGQICCYINLEKPIDKSRFEFFGINLNDLILCEFPNNAEKALEVIRTLCKEKIVDLIIIDSIQGLAPKDSKESKGGKERGLEEKEIATLARTMSKFFPVVGSDVFNAKASVIFIGQVRVGGIGSFFTHAELTGGEAQKFYAYQIVFMRKGQKSNNPQRKFKEYYLDPDGQLRYQTKTVDIGFSVVMRMDKTNSSKSAKEYQDIEIPFYYDSGFKTPETTEDVQIRIDPEAPEPEQEKIKEMMIEKGILHYTQEEVDNTVKELDNLLKDVPDDKIEAPEYDKVTEGYEPPKSKKKKRGRPKKNE